MIRVSLKIHGKVQGVFFRRHAKQKAVELNVTGWVANQADGTVELTAEGEENKINTLVEWCYSGPSTSEVKKVEVTKEDYMREFTDFDIRY